VRAWFAELAKRPPPPDLAAAYFALGEAIAREGISAAALDAFDSAGPIRSAAIGPWLSSASRHLRTWHGTFAAFRSERDLVLRAIGWLAAAAEALLPALDGETVVVPPIRPEAEALSFRSDVHGYAFFGMLPLASALRARAVRALIARTLPAVLSEEDRQESACRDPWTLVEAMFRGHGLDAYARELP
jgi:lysine-N-methylase